MPGTPPILNSYRGELLSLRALAHRTGIQPETLSRWHRRFGHVSEARIERHLADTALWKRVRELTAANGLNRATVRMRVYRGLDPIDAATLPLQQRATR